MLITNNSTLDYYFGALHLPGGIGQTLTVDDSSSTSLYLTDDGVADQINTLSASGTITVSGVTTGIVFPRPTGEPQILHGDGSPEGLVYAGQGSMFMVRTTSGSIANSLYTKTTGVHLNTGWVAVAAPPVSIGADITAPSTDLVYPSGIASYYFRVGPTGGGTLRSVTAPTYPGSRFTVHNLSGSAITLKQTLAGGTGAQLALKTGADTTLGVAAIAEFLFDTTYWRQVV